MRTRTLLVTVTLGAGLVALSPGGARAGGSWIEFPADRGVVGTSVTGVGHFGEGQQLPVSAGPWFARLSSDGPDGVSIALGSVSIGESNFYGWKATVSFTVPDVPTGEYWLHIVNAQGDGVGDLIGGVILVAHTPLEAQLWSASEKAERQLADRERELRAAQQREEQLRVDLADRGATIDRQAQRLADVGARSATLEAELAALRAADETPSPVRPISLLSAVIVALTATAFAFGRRRSAMEAAELRASGDADAGDGREALVNAEPGPARVG